MNFTSITQQQEVKKCSSNELRKKVLDYRKNNEYLAKMTVYNENKSQMIRDGIMAERIR